MFGTGVALAYHLHGSYGLLALLGVLIFIVAGVYMQFLLRCPQCGNKIGAVLIGSFGVFLKNKKEVVCCPYCQLDLDRKLKDINGSQNNFNAL
jgi:DNA-directed RNA polymerase subunit RPC12/RpoP